MTKKSRKKKKNMQINNKYNIEELKWDTEFFGVKSARVILNNSIDKKELNEILKKIESDNYEFITINNVKNNDNNNYILKNVSNMFLADVNVQFEKRVEKKNEIDNNVSIHNNFEYNQEILEISKKSFVYSRFMNDLNLEKSSDVYVEWAKNSFNKGNKYFCVYKIDSKVVGYLLFSIEDMTLTIELIAVDNNYKGKGIGKRLVNKVENFAYLNNINIMKVGTQLNNIYAQNFYINNGFRHISYNSIYHLWINS